LAERRIGSFPVGLHRPRSSNTISIYARDVPSQAKLALGFGRIAGDQLASQAVELSGPGAFVADAYVFEGIVELRPALRAKEWHEALAGLVANAAGLSAGLNRTDIASAAFWVPASFVAAAIAATVMGSRLAGRHWQAGR